MEPQDPSLIAAAVCGGVGGRVHGSVAAPSPVASVASLLTVIPPRANAVSDFERLAALQRTALLDSPAEDSFDRLTRLARRLLGVPVALVSLVDDHRQFFKSADGLAEPWASLRETPLSHSFCQHVVTQSAPLIVEDARLDPLVRDNLAVRDLGVIAYAGMPLSLPDGHVLGSFAAIDVVPRKWTDDDLTTLRDLAAAAMTEAELRLSLEEAQRQTANAQTAESLLRQSEFRVRVMLDVASDTFTSFPEKLKHLLRIGCQQLGLLRAFIAEQTKPEGGAVDAFRIAWSFSLVNGMVSDEKPLQDALCRRVLATGEKQPLPDIAFIGAPIRIADGDSGCLCFYGASAQQETFGLSGQEFVNLLAQWIGSEMSRQRSEAALAKTQERYELALLGSKDGLWDWDIVSNEVINSPRWKAMLGYADHELPNDPTVWDTLLHPDDKQTALRALNDHLAGLTSEYEVEYRMRHRDGTYRWVLARGLALRDANGVPQRMAGSHSDITLRKQSEAALRESEANLAEAQKVAQVGSWTRDLIQGRYFWSRQMFLLYGFDPSEPEPSLERVRECAHPDDRGRIAESITRCTETGETQTLHCRIYRADDGALRHLHAILTPKRSVQGTVTSLSGTVMDVTAQKEEEQQRVHLTRVAQEARARADESRAQMEIALHREKEQADLLRAQSVELARARDEALKHTRTKSEFLANMSHEIRTPMNGVLGMTSLLLDTTLTPNQKDYAQSIQSSASALLTVINDILDFSKIESGKLTLEETDFDLRSLLEETVAIVAPTAHAKGLELTCRVAPPEMPLVLKGDSGRLRQVLTNLLGNAIKFTETGNVGVTATAVREDDREVVLTIAVADTGIGIEKSRQEAIFESFIQADGSTTRRYGGTGLGLTISRQIISLMGGRIRIDSEPGKGSIFTLELTLPKGEPTNTDAARDALRGLRVLAVDDNAINRQILGEQLTAWGCLVSLADSGDAALALLHAETDSKAAPFDAILLDMQMPGMDGAQLAQRIRGKGHGKQVPMILLSSSFAGDAAEQGFAALFGAVLIKPVRQSALFGAMLRLTAASDTQIARGKGEGTTVPDRTIAGPCGIHILLAEDNPVNQKVAVHLLKKWDSDVTVVSNGKAAMDAAIAASRGENPFDLVLMDVQMPEMDGMTATVNLRSLNILSSDRTRRLPIIALTAHSMQGDRERCLAAGMDDYLSKPINEADLRAALLRWSPTADTESIPPASLPVSNRSANATNAIDSDGRLLVRRDRLWECCGGDAELVREVGEEFLQSVPPVISRMAEGVAVGEASVVRFEAHTLRGSCRTVGADSLEFVCGLLEEQAAAGSLANTTDLMERARDAAAKLVPALNQAMMETETVV